MLLQHRTARIVNRSVAGLTRSIAPGPLAETTEELDTGIRKLIADPDFPGLALDRWRPLVPAIIVAYLRSGVDYFLERSGSFMTEMTVIEEFADLIERYLRLRPIAPCQKELEQARNSAREVSSGLRILSAGDAQREEIRRMRDGLIVYAAFVPFTAAVMRMKHDGIGGLILRRQDLRVISS